MDSYALGLLHPKVQQAVWQLGWQRLYPIQEMAIRAIMEETCDCIVCAPTSGGKSEAVAFPVFSQVLAGPASSFQALYVFPLKSLINDQYLRFSSLGRELGIPVHRWHGDVDQNRKQELRRRPEGILLTTPESLESNFVNFSHVVLRLYRSLQFIVIDELHAFLENERGIHLRSLLARLVDAIGYRPRCFGLSATLGDPLGAQAFINSDNPNAVRLIEDRSTARRIEVSVKTCPARICRHSDDQDERDGALVEEVDPDDDEETSSHVWRPWAGSTVTSSLDPIAQIALDLQQQFHGSTNLVFANSRRTVEMLADYLHNQTEIVDDAEWCFALHHGSLSRQVRHCTESALKSGRPTNALCTSSLELGIDVGAISAVAQIDAPWTVAALAQRLGRSGRRQGQPSVLRLYVRLPQLGPASSLTDMVSPPLLQAAAMIQLLLAGWLEPDHLDRMNLSTLVHQVLSKIKETGGMSALELYRSLCERGPFKRVGPSDFKQMLRSLVEARLIDQGPDHTIIMGMEGEKITSAPDFYAAFSTPVELSVRHGSQHIGKLPVAFGLKAGDCLLLNGKRWLVDEINWKAKTIWVEPTKVKKPPVFLGSGGDIHTRIYTEMRRVLCASNEPYWLDEGGFEHLQAARRVAREAGLSQSNVIQDGGDIRWFPWTGSRVFLTLMAWAKVQRMECSRDFLSLTYPDTSMAAFRRHLRDLVESKVDPIELAAALPNRHYERFDRFIDPGLLDKANAFDRLDLSAAQEAASRSR